MSTSQSRPQLVHPGPAGVLALALLAVPIGFQLLFAIGEVAGGDASGLVHLVTAAPLIAVAVIALRRPALAGAILLLVGLAIALGYLILVSGRAMPIETIVIVEAILLVPVVAGILLIASVEAAGRHHPAA